MSGSNSSSLWRNAADWVSIQIAAVQSSLNRLINTQEGSFTLALAQADSSVSLYLQNQIIHAMLITRAGTCAGSDLDSLYNQFGFFRLGAVAASGPVSFSRASSGYAAAIPLGAIVTTGVGGIQFQVIQDTANAYWDAMVGSSGGYTIPSGTASASIPVQAVVSGITGNVGVGTINTVVQSINYIDTVTNPAAFANGLPAELDSAFRARFVLWVNSRSLGVKAAIESAILSVQQGLSYQIIDNALPGQSTGTTPGAYAIYVDDGSGATPSTTISLVFAAVDAVNGFTIEPYVQAATAIIADISLGLEVGDGYVFATVQSQASAALQAFGATLKVGQTLPYYSIPQVVIDSSSGVGLLSNVSLNGGTADMVPGIGQIVRLASPTINQVGG